MDTEGYLVSEETLRFLADLRHWWGGSGGGLPPAGILGGPLPTTFRWIQLKTNLDAGGTAEGNLCDWSTGSKTYSPDTTETFTVTDTTEQCFGLIGERVLCRPVPADDGTVWEVVRGGACRHRAVLTESLGPGMGAVATVVVADGTPSGVTVAVAVFDDYLTEGSLPEGALVGISYDVSARCWFVTNAKCSY